MKFTIKRNVKCFIRKSGMRVRDGFILELENKIENLLQKSIERARANRRTTLLESDL